ncbi:MAG: hypothetical protein AUK35_06160 [Zetaproteobacteria bacterium CG2_30_46_52]|nr:MAG: hypothetical protein AUK35_06160 [Zetaproteobacteria bacterium CG2_30_46_52]
MATLTKLATYLSLFLTLIFLVLISVADGNAQQSSDIVQHEEWISPLASEQHIALKTRTETLQSGDTAGVVLQRLGFSNTEAANIIAVAKPVYALSNIYAGNKIVRQDFEDAIAVTYHIDSTDELHLMFTEKDGWHAEVVPREMHMRTSVARGTIEDNLFYDAAKAGLEDNLTIQLMDMFAWDIDFARDLRKGDSFKVLFEEAFDDEGKRVGYKILAAQFKNRGQLFTGIRYENKKGDIEYYSEEGKNLRKTYLKSPVKFSRISSNFSDSRKHPVLGYTRAHRGIDYAAKSGTPIRAIGDGRISYLGWKSGYGRFIEIRHNNGTHSTAYAHMRAYGKGVSKGSYVKQGQIIGYVGMSGLATGPHLHFEFRTRGVAVNPLSVKHKPADPLPDQEMSAFRVKANSLLREIEFQSKTAKWG